MIFLSIFPNTDMDSNSMRYGSGSETLIWKSKFVCTDFAYLKWGRFETAWCKRRERTICHRARIIHNQILHCHLVLTIFIMVKICVLIYIKSLIQNVMYSIYYVGHSCRKGNLLPQVSK